MAMNFVESAVLMPEHGIGHAKETKIEITEEQRIANQKAADAAERKSGVIKSLGQQLADNKASKDAEWKQQNNPFKPPPSMTEDEFSFLQEKEAAKAERLMNKRKQEDEDKRQFEEAMLERQEISVPTEPVAKVVSTAEKPIKKSLPLIPVKVVKKSKPNSNSKVTTKRKREEPVKDSPKPKQEEVSTALNILGQYGDDEE